MDLVLGRDFGPWVLLEPKLKSDEIRGTPSFPLICDILCVCEEGVRRRELSSEGKKKQVKSREIEDLQLMYITFTSSSSSLKLPRSINEVMGEMCGF